ncbi:DUF4192 domain-containing protein [Streptomyces palmae]|uniref:DUF4192 domain-containing protein n=1 Tax=Streptomyces palmae TaxID=1701085 RepID=A0A4Z0HBZ4_9ACTN|nr:DUF4192 domain-containing protein [Streptomyces palmae]TGB16914.1 DUF4192 domain-containing protein [Streptomyces palmae]
MTRHNAASSPFDQQQVTLSSPAELADALPFLLGFHPDDSVVLVALHGAQGRFGGRLRLGIPEAREDWPEVSAEVAECLITGSERRGARPDGIVLFLCQDPSPGESGRQVMERLRPLAQQLRVACGNHEVPVLEALCIADRRFWSYCCPDRRCCPEDGTPLGIPGTSVMAAAATFAGIRVRGTLREMEARLAPLDTPRAEGLETALDEAAAAMTFRILDGDRAAVRRQTLDLLSELLERLRSAGPVTDRTAADLRDDALLGAEEAAAAIIGLQDHETRDEAAAWMEGPDAAPALRLWRALARRCVGAYASHASAPLTLAGWVALSSGDEPAARVALGRALKTDPDYLFAQLLHHACNEGVDLERLRRHLRRRHGDQTPRTTVHPESVRAASGGSAGPDGASGSRANAASGCHPVLDPGAGPERGVGTADPAAAAAPAADDDGDPGGAGPTAAGDTASGRVLGSRPRRGGGRGTAGPGSPREGRDRRRPQGRPRLPRQLRRRPGADESTR